MGLDIAALDADLLRDEGKKSVLYKDKLGNYTIGIGHLCTPEEVTRYTGVTLTDAQIQMIYTHDRDFALYQLDQHADWWRGLADDAQRAFSNQSYNMGWGRLQKFVHMIAALKVGDYLTAAAEALASEEAEEDPDRMKRIALLYQGCGPSS